MEPEVLTDWMLGKEYRELADTHFSGNLERLVNEIDAATYEFPWAVSALVQHLEALVGSEAVPRLLRSLGSLAFHGVPDIGSAYAISIGVRNRELALRMAQAYRSEKGSFSYIAFREWLQGLDMEDWRAILKGEKSEEIESSYERVAAKLSAEPRAAALEFNLADIQVHDSLQNEDLIVVKSDADFWLCTYDYERVGRLVGANVDRLKAVDRGEHDLIVDSLELTERILRLRVL